MNNNENQVYGQIKEILTTARAKAYSAVNFAMVEAYWLIGKQIVEAKAGNERAEYGTQLLKYLSEQLTHDFGKGFEESNLRLIRQFYLTFQIRDALRHELSWSQYRLVLRVSEDNKQIFASKYMLYLPTEEELKKEIYAAMSENKELTQ